MGIVYPIASYTLVFMRYNYSSNSVQLENYAPPNVVISSRSQHGEMFWSWDFAPLNHNYKN